MENTTFKEKVGYGIASLGDAISYSFVGTFFLFFLTTIAHIPPALAGVIVAVGSVWNAVFNPVMGYLADNISTRFGRRRPVIFVFSIFLGIMLFLMFTDVNIPMSFKPMYYGIMTVLFWTAFTGFFVPYCALGTDYASTYDERTSIRSFAAFFNLVGTLFCMVMPTIIVEFLQQHGFTAAKAWSFMGGLLAVITSVTIIITVIVSKHRDLPCERTEKKPSGSHNILNIFSEYISVARLKPMKYLIVASLCSLIVYTMLMSNVMYFFTFNLKLTAAQISLCLLIRSLLGMTFLPLISKLSVIFDKRIALVICYSVGIIGMIALRFLSLEGFPGAIAYTFFLTVCTSAYWQMMPSIFYDICDYDKSVTGKQREAMILSFQGLVEAIAVGIGGQILGAILQMAGFDGNAAAQTAHAMTWIENSATVIPMIFMAISAVALYKYPLRRDPDKITE